MAEFIVKDSIEIKGRNSSCPLHEIQLCYGSVTKIPSEQPVDVLVVSAFPDNYVTTSMSVIGALWRDLKISVYDLSLKKKEDLRHVFSCWWSKKLPNHYGFRRILCFEGAFKKGVKPPMVVSEIFRCLVSMCKQKPLSVMMPLLSTGAQAYSGTLMLRLIINAAIHWIQIGLPLHCLKIVVHNKSPEHHDFLTDPIFQCFEELKAKQNKRTQHVDLPQEIPIKYDIYLSFNQLDKRSADDFIKRLAEKKADLKIFVSEQHVNQEKSFQSEMYETMVCCAKVVALLSPNYLQDAGCIEQYNIALCCSRNVKRDYLAPFYVYTMKTMPNYMRVIQYIDCRPLCSKKMNKACEMLLARLDIKEQSACLYDETTTNKASKVIKKTEHLDIGTTYDIFISYAHVNSEIAHQIYETLKTMYPDWKIFIDTTMLGVGDAWQVKLYESIEASKVVVALLSIPYLNSMVCQEEYNLAYALHHDTLYKTSLIAFQIEEFDSLPIWCSGLKPIDATYLSKKKKIKDLISSIKSFYDNSKNKKSSKIQGYLSDLLNNWRCKHIDDYFTFLPLHKLVNSYQVLYDKQSSYAPSQKLVLCYNQSDKEAGEYLYKELESFKLGFEICKPVDNDEPRLIAIDSALLVVPLLSAEFLASPVNMAELNTAIGRHGQATELVMFPIILDALPFTPAYIHLVWCILNCLDSCWLDRDAKPYRKCLKMAAEVICKLLAGDGFLNGKHRILMPPNELQCYLKALTDNKDDGNEYPNPNLDFNPLLYKKYQS